MIRYPLTQQQQQPDKTSNGPSDTFAGKLPSLINTFLRNTVSSAGGISFVVLGTQPAPCGQQPSPMNISQFI